MSRSRISINQRVGVGGRVIGTLVFLLFFAVGLVFCVFLGREVYLNAQAYRWPKVECVILDSRVIEDGKRDRPYRFHVRYEYEWQGRTYSSEKWSRSTGAYSDYGDAQALANRFPLDSKAACFVNPANPSEALLERPSLWIGLIILLPLVFVGIGAVGVVAMWSKAGEARKDTEEVRSKPISSVGKGKVGARIGAVFFGFFLAVGTVVFYFITVRPMLQVIDARDWIPTPCTVISSRVQIHRGDDGTTYRVDILYRYEVNGEEHRSSRYQFMGGSSSGRRGKAAVVRRFPPGARRTCYVNPRNPSDAVLERGLTADMWFGAIPAVFMLVGAGGLFAMLRGKRRVVRSRYAVAEPETVPAGQIVGATHAVDSASETMDDPTAPRVLKPAGSRLVGLIAIGVFTAIWNGVLWFVSLPILGIFRRGASGAFDWVHLIFLLPFLAVGLVLIGVVIYQWLALYNPKPELTISPGVPALGGKLDLDWRLIGRTHMLRDLTIVLEAREEATYRQGTQTHTDKKVFFKLDAVSVPNAAAMPEGRASLTLPFDTVPTFKGRNNRIVWSLRVAGSIPRWPDLKEEFVIEVTPPANIPAST